MNEAVSIYEWLTELSMDYDICFYVEPMPMVCQRHVVIYDKKDKSHFADCNIPEVIFSGDDIASFKLYMSETLASFGIEEDPNVNKT